MFENKNELEAREEILSFVDEYCKKYHAKKEYHEGDRISYASRVQLSLGNNTNEQVVRKNNLGFRNHTFS